MLIEYSTEYSLTLKKGIKKNGFIFFIAKIGITSQKIRPTRGAVFGQISNFFLLTNWKFRESSKFNFTRIFVWWKVELLNIEIYMIIEILGKNRHLFVQNSNIFCHYFWTVGTFVPKSYFLTIWKVANIRVF